MKGKNKNLSIVLIAILLVGIAIVIVIAGKSEKPEQITDSATQVEEVVIADTKVPATETTEAAEPTVEAVAEVQAPPTPKSGLESTDPSTVNLASGKLQLVEAFAFW